MFRKMLTVLTVIAVCGVASVTFADKYAAIALSRSTWNSGIVSGYSCLEEAKAAALAACDEDDAQIVICSRNGWCALAVGTDGSIGVATAASQEEAESLALGMLPDSSDAKYDSEYSGDDE